MILQLLSPVYILTQNSWISWGFFNIQNKFQDLLNFRHGQHTTHEKTSRPRQKIIRGRVFSQGLATLSVIYRINKYVNIQLARTMPTPRCPRVKIPHRCTEIKSKRWLKKWLALYFGLELLFVYVYLIDCHHLWTIWLMLSWENMSKHLHNSFCQQNASGHLWPQSVLKPQESAVRNNYSSRKSSPTFGMWKMLKVSGYIGTSDHLHTNDRNLNLCLV